jgi:arsenite methyltransferase
MLATRHVGVATMSALERLGVAPSPLAAGAESPEQTQTRDAFGFKWSKRATYESAAVQAETKRWLFERYCGDDPGQLSRWLDGERKIILDAGCGSGHSALLFFGDHLKRHDYLGVDISNAVDVARTRFAEAGYSADFLQSDILALPIPNESIDVVFSEGVLHHTDDTRRSLMALAAKVKPGGRMMFYVYAKKAVIREFTDDHVRQALRPLSEEEAWKALEPLTKLGVELGRLGVELDVPQDIPYLGIKAGKMDLQRFFYWNVCKAFYRDDYTLEEMNHVNFDWFRPLNCHRHTEGQIRAWCEEAGLHVERLHVCEAGITTVALKAKTQGQR